MGFGDVGKVWTLESYKAHLAKTKNSQGFRAVTCHHCAAPSLAQRPQGFKLMHLQNMRDFYRGEKGWSSAPHGYIDENEIWGMCPLTERGIHAASFNSYSVGLEMLGDFDSEDPKSGRGLQVATLTAGVVAALLDWMGKEPSDSTVLFHRDDPKTTKTCPGTRFGKDWFLELVKAGGGVPVPAAKPAKVILPNGQPFTEATEKDDVTYVAAFPFGRALGLDDDGVKKVLSQTEGEEYDAKAERTVAVLRNFLPGVPGGFSVRFDPATGTRYIEKAAL